MNIKPILSDEDLSAALARMDQLWGAEIGTPEGIELDALASLIEMYEAKLYPMPLADPLETIN